MTSLNHRAAAMLTIFLGLCGFVALTDTPAVSTAEPQSREYLNTFFLEEPGLFTVRVPLDAIESFVAWKPDRFVRAITTHISTKGFEMYVTGLPIQFEFQSGYLIAHFALSSVHAHLSDRSEFFVIDSSGRVDALRDEGLKKLVLGTDDDGITPYFVGHFSVSVIDPRTGVSAPIRDDDHDVSQIVIEPLLKPSLYETVMADSRPIQTVVFNFREQFGSGSIDLELLKTFVYENTRAKPGIPTLVLND